MADALPLATILAPARTALLVIDVQRDFAAPDGFAGRSGADLSAVGLALHQMERLTRAARAADATVAFAHLETRPETDPPVLTAWMERRGTIGQIGCCRAGTPGAGAFALVPERDDLRVTKLLYSAFAGTDLAQRLSARGVDTLLLAGLTTECCVLATAFDGFHRSFHILVARDACAAYGPAMHEGALAILEANCALLAETDAVIEGWTGATQ